MKILPTLSFFSTLLFLLATGLVNADAPRPNIVLVLCDDLGYSDVGFNGATDIRTPEMDKLADEGTIFTSAYVVHPFCGPSRMGLMAGRYPHEFGAPFNLPNCGLGIEEWNHEGIDVKETLMSTVLQDAGYYTGAFGKWHMGIDPQFHPNKRGFDEYYGFLGGGHSYFPDDFAPKYERQKKSGTKWINEYFLPLQYNGIEVEETEYITDALSREAVKFVHKAAKKDQPFFIYLAYNAPHSPLEAKEEDLALYTNIKDKKRKAYAAMVHAVDRGVGELVDALKSTGAYKNTLIIFLSDNGGKLSLGATNRPLTEGKGSTKEGGFRVPMFFHWPDNVPAGTRYDHPVSALDFYPTFAALAGAKIPSGKDIDGKNIWNALLTGESARKGGMIFAVRHRQGLSDVGARRDQWKVVRQSNGPWRLYDVDSDLSEKRDLSANYPELIESMVSQVEKWSHSHTQPKWFYIREESENWKADKMPRYEETFSIK